MRILRRRDGGPKGAALLGVHLEVFFTLYVSDPSPTTLAQWHTDSNFYKQLTSPLSLSGTSAEQSTPGRSQASHRIQNLLP